MIKSVQVLIAGLSAFIWIPDAAQALVGQSNSGGGAARHTVMVLKAAKSGAGNCSGVVMSPSIILTAAHCVTPALQVAVLLPGRDKPAPILADKVSVHPEYVPDAIRKRVRSIDLALLHIAGALPPQFVAPAIATSATPALGSEYLVAGFGIEDESRNRLSGELRSGLLRARNPLSSILLWAEDPQRKGFGACTGDSGGPIFNTNVSELIAITVWSSGARGRKCGDLTQGILVAPHRRWIESTITQWSAK